MKEDFVTYEQAVQLKELGFDRDTDYYYSGYDKQLYSRWMPNGFDYNEPPTPAPTLSQAQKWLREVKETYVEARLRWSKSNEVKFEANIGWPVLSDPSFFTHLSTLFDTYEAALSAGVDEALECLKRILDRLKELNE